jgi:hypothetical protein
MKLVTNITNSLEEKETTLSIFLDLSKAFDTINHDILLRKLAFYGIRGMALDWFKSYLTNRTQFVSYGGCSSTSKLIECGIPQGSVLGPLLFIIYTNDLPNCLNYAKTILFADDTTVYMSSKDEIKLFHNMNTDLTHLTDWFYANKLSLNASKTNYLKFTNILYKNNAAHYNNHLNIKLANQVIIEAKSTKFLGIQIDNKLKWDTHINYTKQKLTRSLYALNRLKHTLQRKSLKLLYYSFIYPYLNYGILLWGAAFNKYLTPLIRLQKKAVRIVSGANYNDSTKPIFINLEILKLEDIYKLEISKYVYRCILKLLPLSMQNIFTLASDTHNRITRQTTTLKLRVTKPRIITTKQCSTYMGPFIWNSLPNNLYLNKNVLISYTGFSSRFKRHTLKSYSG